MIFTLLYQRKSVCFSCLFRCKKCLWILDKFSKFVLCGHFLLYVVWRHNYIIITLTISQMEEIFADFSRPILTFLPASRVSFFICAVYISVYVTRSWHRWLRKALVRRRFLSWMSDNLAWMANFHHSRALKTERIILRTLNSLETHVCTHTRMQVCTMAHKTDISQAFTWHIFCFQYSVQEC